MYMKGKKGSKEAIQPYNQIINSICLMEKGYFCFKKIHPSAVTRSLCTGYLYATSLYFVYLLFIPSKHAIALESRYNE